MCKFIILYYGHILQIRSYEKNSDIDAHIYSIKQQVSYYSLGNTGMKKKQWCNRDSHVS